MRAANIEDRGEERGSNQSSPEPQAMVEGSLEGCMAVFGSFLIYFATFGVINSFGTFQGYYESEYLHTSSSTAIAFIGTLQISLLYLISPLSGALFDSYPIKYLYLTGGIGTTLSLVALSFTKRDQLWQQLLSQGLLFGLTVSFGAQPAIAIAGHYFKKRRALAMGIVAAGSSVGGVCLPIMLSRLFKSVGFAWAVRVQALLVVVCYGLAVLVTRARKPLKPPKKWNQLLNFRGFKDSRFSILALGSLLSNIGLYIPYYYIESYAIIHGISDSIHPYLLACINAASFFGRIIGGQLGDRLGVINMLYPATLLCVVLDLAMWLVATNGGTIIAFACIYGFFSGAIISIIFPAVAQLSPAEDLGAYMGAFSTVLSVGTLIGTPVGGAFLNNDGSKDAYKHLIIFGGCIMFAGAAVTFVARTRCSRNLLAKF